jgi:hypothetical protein
VITLQKKRRPECLYEQAGDDAIVFALIPSLAWVLVP